MNGIRIAISIFLVLLAIASIWGVLWASRLPTPPQIGGRIVLLISSVVALLAVKVLWSPRGEESAG